MKKIEQTFTAAMAGKLRTFLASPQRPPKTMTYHELHGLLFALVCTPDLVKPSEWLPLIFGDEDVNFGDKEEVNEIFGALMALYNQISSEVQTGRVALPKSCRVDPAPLANLEPAAPLREWSRGFQHGYIWLEETWNTYTPKKLDTEVGGQLLVLMFFSDPKIAKGFLKEVGKKESELPEIAEQMIKLFPDAMKRFAHMGTSIWSALLQDQEDGGHAPTPAPRIDRNDPCPCGSGKKYKRCCGFTLRMGIE